MEKTAMNHKNAQNEYNKQPVGPYSTYLISGGNWNNGAHCGARCLNGNNMPRNANTNVGVRLVAN